MMVLMMHDGDGEKVDDDDNEYADDDDQRLGMMMMVVMYGVRCIMNEEQFIMYENGNDG